MKFFKQISIAFALIMVSMPASAQFTTGGKASSSTDNGEYALSAGYKGFVDLGYGIGVGDYSAGRVEFQTTHGYQFNPYFFAGVGAGYSYYTDGSVSSIPIFADFKAGFPINRITPFFDFKIGYSVLDVDGFYLSPSVGARFATGARTGVSLALGYEMQKYEMSYYYYSYYYSVSGTERVNAGAITIKLGFDF